MPYARLEDQRSIPVSRTADRSFGRAPTSTSPASPGSSAIVAGLPAEEADYYRLTIPPNTRSWRVRVTTSSNDVRATYNGTGQDNLAITGFGQRHSDMKLSVQRRMKR